MSCRAKYVHLELVEKVQKHPRVTALPPNVLSIARLKASLQGCHTVHPMARSGLGPCDAPRAPPATNTRGTHSSKRARPVPGSIPGLDHTLHNTTPLPFHPPASALYAFRRGLARRATPRTRLFCPTLIIPISEHSPSPSHNTATGNCNSCHPWCQRRFDGLMSEYEHLSLGLNQVQARPS